MRSKKSLVAVLVLVLTIIIIPSTIAASFQKQAAVKLVDLGILKGYGKDNLGLGDAVTRAQMVTFMMRIEGKEQALLPSSKGIAFKDVPTNHWGRNAIQNAVTLGYAKGYSAHVFGPENPVKYEEVCAFMLRLLGKDKNLQGTYPSNYVNKARELGITKNVTIKVGQPATRGDVVVMLWNSLLIPKN